MLHPGEVGVAGRRHAVLPAGVIAQQLEEVFPDWIEDTESGYKSVTFRGFECVAPTLVPPLAGPRTTIGTLIRPPDM